MTARDSNQPAKRVLVLVGVVVIVGLVLFMAFSKSPAVDKKDTPKTTPLVVRAASDVSARNDAATSGSNSAPLAPINPKSQSSENARQLVKILAEIKVQPGEVTPQNADQWKQHLEQLIEQGRAAIPVLDEYFESNQNIQFDTDRGANLLGEPTLRIALLKVLFDLPSPENVQLQEKILQVTTDPQEIALLAHQLEMQEPGEHYRSIIQAARRALQPPNNAQLADHDASPLLKILEGYGIPTK